MLIECPECKNAVSDKAPACPKCGVELTTVKPGRKLGSAKKAQQWARAFFWIFVICMITAVVEKNGKDPILQIIVAISLFGWIGAKIRLWFYT